MQQIKFYLLFFDRNHSLAVQGNSQQFATSRNIPNISQNNATFHNTISQRFALLRNTLQHFATSRKIS